MLAVVACVAVGAAVVLSRGQSSAFVRYFGHLPPVLATILVVTTGWLALRFLERIAWFEVWVAGGGAIRRATGWGAVLALPTIVVDLFGGFAQGINVPSPAALLFYPLMALVAECVFHLVPLALLALTLRALRPETVAGATPSIILLAVALIEPAVQVAWGAGSSPAWANAFVGANVLVFNVAGLQWFRRYDFFTMYAFRIGYYATWHVAWGALRFGILFGG